MRRMFMTAAIAVVVLVLAAVPASAHNEFEPAEAAPGSVVDLKLFVENEQPAAGTSKVQLQFPQPITIAALPAVPGWTATPVDGKVGSPATGVLWQGTPSREDLRLPIKLGPLPATPGRLQFKTIQTYDNGEVDRWIADWPKGASEPDNPGLVLDLVPGAAGQIPATTVTTAATTTTTASTPTTLATDESAAKNTSNDDDSRPLPWVLGGIVVLALIGGGGFALYRARRQANAP